MRFILYDFMQVSGGAERVTLTLAKVFSDSRIIVSRIYSDAQPLLVNSEVEIQEIRGGWSSILPRIFESIWCFLFRAKVASRSEFVIYSGFYAPLAVHGQSSGRRFYYCHTIPRFAYDMYWQELRGMPYLLRIPFSLFVCFLRKKYEYALSKMDVICVNSENVKRRLNKFTGLDAMVVYPPVAVSEFRNLGDDGYFISTARLVKNKRVDVIIEAFKQSPHRRLLVVSSGPELQYLKSLAAGFDNIQFSGWQTEEQLQEAIGRARCLIYLPVDEDFGISPVEAMAAGKPVIGVAEGGLLETVVHGKTGWLIEAPPTPEGVLAAVLEIDARIGESMSHACQVRAAEFSEDVFSERIRTIFSG